MPETILNERAAKFGVPLRALPEQLGQTGCIVLQYGRYVIAIKDYFKSYTQYYVAVYEFTKDYNWSMRDDCKLVYLTEAMFADSGSAAKKAFEMDLWVDK